MFVGLIGPSLLSNQQLFGAVEGAPALPGAAFLLDTDTYWILDDSGTAIPDGWAAVDVDSDIVADSSATSGLDIGIDVDTDPYVVVP